MIVTWIIFVPIAIFINRYTRAIWPPKRVLNAPLWLNVSVQKLQASKIIILKAHRALMILAALSTLASIICIFYTQNWEWIGLRVFTSVSVTPNLKQPAFGLQFEGRNVHAFAGFIACCIIWFQVLNSSFRCRPNYAARSCFNWLHRIIGFIGWFLGSKRRVQCEMSRVRISASTLGIAFWYLPRFMNVKLARAVFIFYIIVILGAVAILEPLKWRIAANKRKLAATAMAVKTTSGDGDVAASVSTATSRKKRRRLKSAFARFTLEHKEQQQLACQTEDRRDFRLEISD